MLPHVGKFSFGPTPPFYFENYLDYPDVRIDLVSGTYYNDAEIVGSSNDYSSCNNIESDFFSYNYTDGLDISLHAYSSQTGTYAHIYIDGVLYHTENISVGLVQHWVYISAADAATWNLDNGLAIYIDNTP